MDKMDHLIKYDIFKQYKNIFAFTTTKQVLNHSAPRFTGDLPEIFESNRIRLARIIGIEPEILFFPRQTHSCTVAEINCVPSEEIKETDALITTEKSVCLCVQTADCVPILLFDPVSQAIAAIHAGWKGTVNKIAGKTVAKMKAVFHSNPENIIAAIGPSIGPEIYEVSNEVVELAKKNLPYPELLLQKNKSGKFHFNLWEANRQILIQNGLKEENIEVLAECSFQNAEKFYSARREGTDTGRMVSGIMLR